MCIYLCTKCNYILLVISFSNSNRKFVKDNSCQWLHGSVGWDRYKKLTETLTPTVIDTTKPSLDLVILCFCPHLLWASLHGGQINRCWIKYLCVYDMLVSISQIIIVYKGYILLNNKLVSKLVLHYCAVDGQYNF